MLLDTINMTIGGDEYISLPVALQMPYTKMRTDLCSKLLERQALTRIDWYLTKHSRLTSEQMYVSVQPDLDSTRMVHELCCAKTNSIQFRFTL